MGADFVTAPFHYLKIKKFQRNGGKNMGADNFLSAAFVPILMAGGLGYYAIRILVFHDLSSISGKDKKRKYKNEEMYAKTAGKLMLFLSIASLAMSVILYWYPKAAMAEILVCIVIFGILWKRMHEKYGD